MERRVSVKVPSIDVRAQLLHEELERRDPAIGDVALRVPRTRDLGASKPEAAWIGYTRATRLDGRQTRAILTLVDFGRRHVDEVLL